MQSAELLEDELTPENQGALSVQASQIIRVQARRIVRSGTEVQHIGVEVGTIVMVENIRCFRTDHELTILQSLESGAETLLDSQVMSRRSRIQIAVSSNFLGQVLVRRIVRNEEVHLV